MDFNNRNIREFIKTYTQAIEESNAAVFAGAGLSKPAGFVNWKELLRDIAQDIELDIDKETDLISIAQYHVNENGGNRGKINQVLIDEFTKDSIITENHKILSQLPINTYWTTNYDTLIEDALKGARKRIDVKITAKNLAFTKPNSDAVVYKMHGDISLPHEAVLTKDDYELYNTKRRLYTTALLGDLVSKTFMFIGFSFDDPNLESILGKIKILLGENQRQHYCFMKKVARDKFKKDEDLFYSEVKQQLKINDLKRFGIKVILVDDYSDITEILRIIWNSFRRKNIFISGSASFYGDWGEQRVFEFATELSKRIIRNDNNIVSGFGLGVGSCIISGALEETYTTNSNMNTEERIKARPFPQNTTGNIPLPELWTKYRTEMIKNVGISIFIFGNKIDINTNKVVDANGMVEEFELSVSEGIVPIPVGATGFASKKLWIQVMNKFDTYIPDQSLKPLYKFIGDESRTNIELIEKVIEIINNLVSRRGDTNGKKGIL
jgi:hypothetical protein